MRPSGRRYAESPKFTTISAPDFHLEMVDRQFDAPACRLMPPASRNGKQCPVSLAFETLVIRCRPQRLSLLRRQPVSQAHSEFLHALDASNMGGRTSAEEAATGCLLEARAARQPADAPRESARGNIGVVFYE